MRFRNIKDTEEWAKGHAGELIVANEYLRLGYYVIPSYDYCGEDDNKAPKLSGLFRGFVVPDLDVSKDGKRVWVEVKTKTKPDWTRRTSTLDHGIPIRHLRDYQKVEEITGCPVWLVIYELDSKKLLHGKIGDIYANGRTRMDLSDKMQRGGMMFFPRDILQEWKVVEMAKAA